MEATCGPLADALHVDQGAAKIAVEDAVRAMPHAPLAQVLAPVEQVLQKLLGGSVWRIVSPMQSGAAVGRLRFEQSLAAVQDLVLQEPTIIIAEQARPLMYHNSFLFVTFCLFLGVYIQNESCCASAAARV